MGAAGNAGNGPVPLPGGQLCPHSKSPVPDHGRRAGRPAFCQSVRQDRRRTGGADRTLPRRTPGHHPRCHRHIAEDPRYPSGGQLLCRRLPGALPVEGTGRPAPHRGPSDPPPAEDERQRSDEYDLRDDRPERRDRFQLRPEAEGPGQSQRGTALHGPGHRVPHTGTVLPAGDAHLGADRTAGGRKYFHRSGAYFSLWLSP